MFTNKLNTSSRIIKSGYSKLAVTEHLSLKQRENLFHNFHAISALIKKSPVEMLKESGIPYSIYSSHICKPGSSWRPEFKTVEKLAKALRMTFNQNSIFDEVWKHLVETGVYEKLNYVEFSKVH